MVFFAQSCIDRYTVYLYGWKIGQFSQRKPIHLLMAQNNRAGIAHIGKNEQQKFNRYLTFVVSLSQQGKELKILLFFASVF